MASWEPWARALRPHVTGDCRVEVKLMPGTVEDRYIDQAVESTQDLESVETLYGALQERRPVKSQRDRPLHPHMIAGRTCDSRAAGYGVGARAGRGKEVDARARHTIVLSRVELQAHVATSQRLHQSSDQEEPRRVRSRLT